jgi:hypothetical protein
MATPKPKYFYAARGFISGGRKYRRGDPVSDRRTIARLVRHGDKYLSWTTKPAPAEPAAVDTANPTSAESEED